MGSMDEGDPSGSEHIAAISSTCEDERPKVYRNGKVVKGEKEKLYDLEDFGGRAWNNQLFRPYISRSTEERLKQSLRR